ncbi:MAG TPA: ATP-binding protein, partial [Bdellovibrionota bacterium]|nr:ATP-binding protein [Bdellovibrionota bacterium]
YIVLAFSAFFFLPRQFHLGVVENSDENHIRTAMWVVPLYLFAISFFVVPIAAAGLILGFNPVEADNLVLTLPLAAGNRWLSLFVCLGGLSAGIGMIMVETMTVSTMISNHLVLPLSSRFKALRGIQRHLLGTRWVAAALFITTGYVYERLFGPNYSLANIGLISFSAMLQLAPPIIAGMFWRRANKSGALLGLTAGFSIWIYCLIVPEFASIGWLPSALVTEGPFGLAFLKPGALFGVTAFNPLTHAVLWSLFMNISSVIIGSLLFTPSTEEEIDASRFVDALEIRPARGLSNQELPDFPVDSKRELIVELFSRYFNPDDAEQLATQALRGFESTPRITVLQLAAIRREIERTLAAAIGSPAAHAAIREQEFMTPEELAALSSAYSDILARLAVHPAELTSRIDYYEERENILERDAGYSRLLARANQQLSSSLNMESTLATIVRFLIPQTADGCVLVLSKSVLNAERFLAAHKDLQREARLNESLNSNELRESLVKFSEGRATAYRNVVELTQNEIAHLRGPSGLEDLPIRSASILTLTSRGNALGSLVLISERPDQFRRPEEINLIEEYGHRCSTALDNAILYAASQEAIQAREDFLSIASHELRTPLTALRTQIQLLIRLSSLGKFDSLSPEKLNSMMIMADRQMDRLSRLIDELLDISRARRGDLELSPSKLDFGHLVREIVERHQIELSQAKCSVELQLEKDVIGFWDRIRLEEVVANLLTNAMKYASGSLITIQLTGTEAGARLSVQDRGVGIHPKDQVRIFKPFQRATEKGQVRGFGLGLYIVHEIVKAHQGKLYLKSEPGKGSTFTIELPKYALKRTA